MSTLEITTNVKNYKGNNGFINSLQNGLKRYGSLTERQSLAAGKFFAKQLVSKTEVKPEAKEVNVNIKINTDNYEFSIKRSCRSVFSPIYALCEEVL